MKVLLAGLGSAGFGWYKKLKKDGSLTIVVAEANGDNRTKLGDDPVPFYTSVNEALDKEKPDFLVNVTPPHVHTPINELAFDRKLPVLCEKPISFLYDESVRIVDRAEREGIPFMIAENYRRFAYFRKLKQLLNEGVIGDISTVHVRFHRYHNVERNYSVSLLDDIGVHHFDLLRYLTGKEGTSVFARLYNPVGSWSGSDQAITAANAIIELEGGVLAQYEGSITSRGPSTEWGGDWRIEGTEGCALVAGKTLRLWRDGEETVISDFSGVHAPDALADFLDCIQNGAPMETSAKDYLKTQALVHFANQSGANNRREDIG